MMLKQLLDRAGDFDDSFLCAKSLAGKEISISFKSLVGEAKNLSKQLASAGLHKGHIIGLKAPNCYEWVVWDLAALDLGLVIHAYPEEQKISDIESLMDEANLALWVDGNSGAETSIGYRLNISDATSQIKVIPRAKAKPLTDEDLHSFTYSSGTTGKLKGLEISQSGTDYLITEFISAFKLQKTDSSLIFLPLSNYQQRMTVYGCLWCGGSILITHYTRIFHELKRFKPTFIIAPPIFYENAVQIFWNDRRSPTDFQQSLGGNIRFMITGMAPIRLDILNVYEQAGIDLFEVYGVTETGMIAWNTPEANIKGSVGIPLNKNHIKIGDDGEVFIKRPFPLSRGYFDSGESEQTNAFLEDGLIATGDIGYFEADHLYLSGRKKDLIITLAGKKFHPEDIEKKIAVIPEIKQCAIFSMQDSGLVVGVLVIQSHDDTNLLAAIRKHIDVINDGLESWEKVQNIIFTDIEFSIENGLLTRNMKLSRRNISSYFKDKIEEILTEEVI